VEKALLKTSVAKECRVFEPRRDHDVLNEALGNPEHRERIWGISSRQS
jgi:hypothetical protein